MNNSISEIEELTKKRQYKQAVQLFKKTEEKLFSQLKGVKVVKILQKRIDEKRKQMINVTAQYVTSCIFQLFQEVLKFEKDESVKKYQFSQNMDMSVLGQSYLGISLDMSLLERKDKVGLIPIKLDPDLVLDVGEMNELIVLIVNYLSIKDFKISHYLESIISVVEEKITEVSKFD